MPKGSLLPSSIFRGTPLLESNYAFLQLHCDKHTRCGSARLGVVYRPGWVCVCWLSGHGDCEQLGRRTMSTSCTKHRKSSCYRLFLLIISPFVSVFSTEIALRSNRKAEGCKVTSRTSYISGDRGYITYI